MIAPAEATRPAVRGGIVLPASTPGRPRPPIDRAALDDALEAGRSLGFVSRDPRTTARESHARKPGPRRREEQDRLCVAGPRRVTEAFRSLCSRLALTHWEALDRLMRATATPPAAAGLRAVPRGGEASGPTAGRAAAAHAGDAAASVRLPHDMLAWVEARVRSARYLDAGDYLRELIRRDQAEAATLLALEAVLSDAVSHGGDKRCDLASFVRPPAGA